MALPEPIVDPVSCCDLPIVCYLCQERCWFQCISYNCIKACSLTQLCPSTAGELNISCTITSNDYSTFNLTTCKISSGDFKLWFFRTEIFEMILQETLTHWGRVTHIWVSNLVVIVSDNGLSPGWRQAIIWTMLEYCQLDPWEPTSLKF